MAGWTTFGSDSDLNRCTNSITVKDPDQLRNNKGYSFTSKDNSKNQNIKLKPDGYATNILDDENFTSLPTSIQDPRLRQTALSQVKSSSSCENLDSKFYKSGNLDCCDLSSARLSKASSDNPLYGTSAAPPVPPRDYTATCSNKLGPRHAEIHPVVRNGQQLTHTHYWLLPDKLPRKLESSPIGDEAPESYINVVPPTPNCSATVPNKTPLSSTRSFDLNAVSSRLGALRKAAVFNSFSGSETNHLLADEADIDTVSVDDTEGICNEAAVRNAEISHLSDHVNDIVQSGSHDEMSMKNVKDLIEEVQARVEGVTFDESYTALSVHSWKVEAAVKYLKVENLFRLGIASRAKCQNLLERHDWNIERAASDMLDHSTPNHNASSKSLSQSTSASKPMSTSSTRDLTLKQKKCASRDSNLS